jgi:predicted Rossmann fold flavoprotein
MHDTLRLFTELGIFTKNRNGYLYPYSDQAASVVEALRMEAEHRKVKLALNTDILDVEKKDGVFLVKTEGWTYEGDALILATGSCAAPQTGSDGSGYELAKKLGHSIVKPLPALVQLRSKDKVFEKLAGLRMDAEVTILADGEMEARDKGEVQFTNYGISGIPVFELSRYVNIMIQKGYPIRMQIDFFPDCDKNSLSNALRKIKANGPYKSMSMALLGMLPEKLISAIITDDMDEEKAAQTIKEYDFPVVSLSKTEEAQVCTGGVDLMEITQDLEVKKVPGLYMTGEALDVDGNCGGYNLQWAWTTGALAGKKAAEK